MVSLFQSASAVDELELRKEPSARAFDRQLLEIGVLARRVAASASRS
jgi:hypothetical protein